MGLLLKPPVTRQKTKFGTTELEFWDEEKTRPRNEHVYDFLMISENPHPAGCHFCKKMKERDDEDNGLRRLYASDKQHYAIQAALGTVQGLELYGPLALQYAADDVAKKKTGYDAPKIWAAKYRNPTDEEVDKCDEVLGTAETVATTTDRSDEFNDLLNSKVLTLEEMQNIT